MRNFELSDEEFTQVIHLYHQYYHEAEKCSEARLFLSGCIMIGAAFQAILLLLANCYSDEIFNYAIASRKDNSKSPKPLIKWTLSELLNLAKAQNWLPSGPFKEKDFIKGSAPLGEYGDLVKYFRNLVHPGRYTIEQPRIKVKKVNLENTFEILNVTREYLRNQVESSLKKIIG